MSDETTAYARASVTIEIEVSGRWGKDCTLEQVNSQAMAAAFGALRQTLSSTVSGQRMKIVGEPVITTIIVPSSVKP